MDCQRGGAGDQLRRSSIKHVNGSNAESCYTALREQLAQAVKAGEIEDKYEAEDAQKAVDRAIEQTQVKEPDAKKITAQIETATTIINKTATVAESLGKMQAFVIKLAPVVTALKHVATWLF